MPSCEPRYGTSWLVMYSTWWLIVRVASIIFATRLAHPATNSPVSLSRYFDGIKGMRDRRCGWVFAWPVYILHDPATTTCSKTLITYITVTRHVMFRTLRRQFRKDVGGTSDSVELVPYVFSSLCVCYDHDAIYIFSCRVCRYELCVRFLWR